MDRDNKHIDPLISKISARQIFDAVSLSEEDIDILVLRFSYEWFYEDIGEYVGMKYRGKPYREGTIRYKLNKSLTTIRDYLEDVE